MHLDRLTASATLLATLIAVTDVHGQWFLPGTELRRGAVNKEQVNARDKDGSTLLHAAAYWGARTNCQELLDMGTDPNVTNKEGWTPLHYAAIFNLCQMDDAIGDRTFQGQKVDTIRLLVARGADVNARDAEGNTPLHWGATSLTMWPGYSDTNRTALEICRILIGGNANVNATNHEGQTVLRRLFERQGGHDDVCSLLISSGADPNIADVDGETPLHLAARNGTTNDCRLLVARGADLHARDRNGRTPLHMAAECGQASVCSLLIAAGADINAKDDTGGTPLTWAVRLEKPDVAELLRKRQSGETVSTNQPSALPPRK